jgi:hypothetical protein
MLLMFLHVLQKHLTGYCFAMICYLGALPLLPNAGGLEFRASFDISIAHVS